jgi:hypothetical protein
VTPQVHQRQIQNGHALLTRRAGTGNNLIGREQVQRPRGQLECKEQQLPVRATNLPRIKPLSVRPKIRAVDLVKHGQEQIGH